MYGLGLSLTGVAAVGGVVRLKPCSSKIICCPTLGCWWVVPGSWIPFSVSYPGLVMKGVFWTVEGTSKISGPWRLGCGRVTSWGSSSSQREVRAKKKEQSAVSSRKKQQSPSIQATTVHQPDRGRRRVNQRFSDHKPLSRKKSWFSSQISL